MKQEEKTKDYDEAIRKLRGMMPNWERLSYNSKTFLQDLIYLFPELKESEDEKIRNGLVRLLKELLELGGVAEDEWDRNECEKYIAWLERQAEQKFANKVEPNFNVGDWIVDKSGFVQQVLNFIGGVYTCTYNSFTTDCESNYHLWTIQDAKDGDVLVGSYGTFILMGKNNGGYCGVLSDNTFIRNTGNNEWTEDLHPATKEQRDFLFEKMKEAGYEWDSEKKELKKFHVIDEGKAEMDYCFIKMMNNEKVSSAWSEEDEKIYQSIIDDTVQENQLDNRQINWIKSLRLQNRWKPSEAQMDSITCVVRKMKESAYYDSELISLFNDLKKLKDK